MLKFIPLGEAAAEFVSAFQNILCWSLSSPEAGGVEVWL